MAFREIRKLQNYNFKYTLSKERIVWCKNVYNGLSQITNIVKEIDWDSYAFDDDCLIQYETETEDSRGSITYSHEYKNMRMKTVEKLKYQIFGGCAYELLDNIYNNQVDLRKFMDPTGDLDVVITIPQIFNQEIYDDESFVPRVPFFDILNTSYVEPDKKINKYYESVITWCYENILEKISNYNLNELFPKSVPFDINEYEQIPTDSKTPNLGFKDTAIGNLHLVSFVQNVLSNMFKIQLIIKIEDKGVSIIDHVMEFIFTYEKYNEIVQYANIPNRNLTLDHCSFLNNINKSIEKCDLYFTIDNLDYMLKENFDAYKRRHFIIKRSDNNSHKAFNHIMRIIYLIELVVNIEQFKNYRIKFFNSIDTIFNNFIFVNKLLSEHFKNEGVKDEAAKDEAGKDEPGKDEPGKDDQGKDEAKQNFLDIIIKDIRRDREIQKTTEEKEFIFKNLYLYFYIIDKKHKFKIVKLKVCDFLNMYVQKLKPKPVNSFIYIGFKFMGTEITGEPLYEGGPNGDAIYKKFMKTIQTSNKRVTYRRFRRDDEVSSVRSEGSNSSRRQNHDEFKEFEFKESPPKNMSFSLTPPYQKEIKQMLEEDVLPASETFSFLKTIIPRKTQRKSKGKSKSKSKSIKKSKSPKSF
jgi:hypothetical protein